MSSSSSTQPNRPDADAIKASITHPDQLGIKARASGPDQWLAAHPPSCGEQKESCLSIRRKPDGLLFHCFTCGMGGDLYDFLGDRMGLDPRNDFPALLRFHSAGLSSTRSNRRKFGFVKDGPTL